MGAIGIVYALAGIGAGVVLLFAYSTVQFLTFHFVTPWEPLKKYKRIAGETNTAFALITGASAGIGLGIAKELARQGFGVVMLGHLADELSEAAAEVRKLLPPTGSAAGENRVRTLVMDARTATPADLEAAVASLSDVPLTILVNNVGGNPVAVPPFRPLATYSCDDVDGVINQNARFMARLTALLLPVLEGRRHGQQDQPSDKSHRSLIISLSSAAHIGLPWLVMYSATKAFNRALGFSLARELPTVQSPSAVPIDSIVVTPGEVLSQGNSRGVPASAPTAAEFGRAIVHKADGAVARGWMEMRAHWWHDVEDVLVRMAPEGPRRQGIVQQVGAKRVAWNRVYEEEAKRE
ncbi:NAD(P)-binding protein [Dichotomopilus funicola]|uniref:NAD(P)-binding protein n=1 Tax=Dichotomopilus funicola TaxID=1934379 RepID=A0AAN6ZHF5_9PEZI|nr:NAD(P)-binding protein [Dichotomopilus funicola]